MRAFPVDPETGYGSGDGSKKGGVGNTGGHGPVTQRVMCESDGNKA